MRNFFLLFGIFFSLALPAQIIGPNHYNFESAQADTLVQWYADCLDLNFKPTPRGYALSFLHDEGSFNWTVNGDRTALLGFELSHSDTGHIMVSSRVSGNQFNLLDPEQRKIAFNSEVLSYTPDTSSIVAFPAGFYCYSPAPDRLHTWYQQLSSWDFRHVDAVNEYNKLFTFSADSSTHHFLFVITSNERKYIPHDNNYSILLKVYDLAAAKKRLIENEVLIEKEFSSPMGDFTWIKDPEGRALILWEL